MMTTLVGVIRQRLRDHRIQGSAAPLQSDRDRRRVCRQGEFRVAAVPGSGGVPAPGGVGAHSVRNHHGNVLRPDAIRIAGVQGGQTVPQTEQFSRVSPKWVMTGFAVVQYGTARIGGTLLEFTGTATPLTEDGLSQATQRLQVGRPEIRAARRSPSTAAPPVVHAQLVKAGMRMAETQNQMWP
jgi:hypothetical protein